jgi:signal transduction histidine kinase
VTNGDGVTGRERAAYLGEIASRAAAIADGGCTQKGCSALPTDLAGRIAAAEERARMFAEAGDSREESHRAAALDFVAAAATTLTQERCLAPGEAEQLVTSSAAAIGVSAGAARFAVFRRALGATELAQLPPQIAIDFVLDLIVELGSAAAVSLWTCPVPGRVDYVASAGVSADSRRMRIAARAVLTDHAGLVVGPASHIRAAVVYRWDRPYAALVARGRSDIGVRLAAYLQEGSSALSPLFERMMLFDRNAARERTLVSACERRLARIGCDLHDGPLQDIVALADDLRLLRRQVEAVGHDGTAVHLNGRFDDLEARLEALDQHLRDISYSVRTTAAVEQPLEHVLRRELDAFERATTTRAELAISGDLSGLTASQRIAVLRVTQEALSNVRKHSYANRVDVHVRSMPRYISVSITDDGCGFDVTQAEQTDRLGLRGMLERIRLLGGDIEIHGGAGRGAQVVATVPRWSPADEQPVRVASVLA